MSEMIERAAKAIYSEDPEDWEDALRIVNGTFGGRGFIEQYHSDTQAHYRADMDEARDKARRVIAALGENGSSVALRALVIEECARELETSYPDHVWLNAACAAIRGLANSGATLADMTKDRKSKT